jgi:hypothetical protein
MQAPTDEFTRAYYNAVLLFDHDCRRIFWQGRLVSEALLTYST